MITTQHLVHVRYEKGWKWAKAIDVSAGCTLVTMRTDGGDTFMVETGGQDTTTGYPTPREAIQRTFPSLVRLSQLTEPDRIYGTEDRERGKRKIGWAQAIHPLRARLHELKEMYLHPERWDDTLEDELTDLRSGEHVFMDIRQKLIRSGYSPADTSRRTCTGTRCS